jgi:hypothetical protein
VVTKFEGPAGGRVESGPLQFADDWPGVFIRGDDAAAFAGALTRSLALLGALASENLDKVDEDRFPADYSRASELAALLRTAITSL